MSQNGNYTNIWALDKDIKRLTKDVRQIYNNLPYIVTLLLISFSFSTCSYDKINRYNKRLDAHKEVIELQQKQINQLIINAKYERNKKEQPH